MSVFDDPTRAEVERRLDALPGPVKLVYFRDPADPEGLSTHVSELLHEVADLGERVSLLEHDFAPGQGESARYAIARAPAIVVEGARDFGIRYYGVPAGYEFGTLLEVMADVAAGSVELPAGLRERLAGLRQPVHIQVFSTPTWPHCPRAVRAAQRLAMASDQVRTDAVEVTEFPDLARKYRITGVPKSVFNETVELLGAAGEEAFLDRALQAAASAA